MSLFRDLRRQGFPLVLPSTVQSLILAKGWGGSIHQFMQKRWDGWQGITYFNGMLWLRLQLRWTA